MSDRPALEVAKKLNEKIEGFVGYSRSHHDIGLELMRAAQSACTAIEQLSDTVESLQRENEERVKAHNEIFDALQKSEMDNEFLRGQLSDWEMTPKGAQEIIQRQADRISELEAAAITPEMREIAAEYAQHERHEPLRLFLLDVAGVLGEQG